MSFDLMADSMRHIDKKISLYYLGYISFNLRTIHGSKHTFVAIMPRPPEIAETLSFWMSSSLSKMITLLCDHCQ